MFPSLPNWFRNNPIPAFLALTFIIAWSWWLPLGLLAPENPLLTLPGAWSPTISALILLRLSQGKGAVLKFLQGLFHWRVGLQWYLVVLFGIAAIAYLAIGIGMVFGVTPPEISLPGGLPSQALPAALPLIFLVNIFLGGPLAEDIGWRGYLLPKMREERNSLYASLIIGAIWAIWHLPYFIFPGWRSLVGNIPFLWFALLTTGWSVLFAWVYVNTESILMPVLFHAAINTTLGTLGLLGQSNGSLMPLVLNTLVTWMAVGIVVLFFGQELKRAESSHVARQANPAPPPAGSSH